MSGSIFKSARVISFLTLMSRMLGLVRDMACSYAFGVGAVWSAFTVAFQVPNLFRRLFGEGALSAASIPVLTEAVTKEGKDAADRLAGRLVGLLVLVLAGLCLIAEGIVAGLYWHYQYQSDTALTLTLTAILLPYMVLICTTAILGGIQNVWGRFASPAAMPIILNVFIIGAALGGRWLFGDRMDDPALRQAIVLLAAAVIVAGIVQVVWQWVAVRRCGLRLHLQVVTSDPRIRRIAWTMVPMLVGLGVVQINTLFDALIAWWFVKEQLVPGGELKRVGPAVLYYAQRLYQFPLGVFALALATAIFPALSRHAAEGDREGLSETLTDGLRVTTFIALPCLLGLILVREPLVRVLFGRGEFSAWNESVDRVAFALCMYAAGILAYAANHLLIRSFYARGDARTPAKVAAVNVVINLALNLILVQTVLQEAGLALSTSICGFIQAIALILFFQRSVQTLAWSVLGSSVGRTFVASIVMGIAVYISDIYMPADMWSLFRLGGLIAVGVASYWLMAKLLGCREIREIAG